MSNATFIGDLQNLHIRQNEPLALYTTWKIGGRAEFLLEAQNSDELKLAIEKAAQYHIPYTILGGGSNVLISDDGLKGLVIINRSRRVIIGNLANATNLDSAAQQEVIEAANEYNVYIQPRHGEVDSSFYSFKDLDYEESGSRILVTFDSGVDLAYAIAFSLKNSVTGLQWFAGIPGTIGGALFNNIHGGTKHFSDNFFKAKVLEISDLEVTQKTVGFEYFNFGYDQSILREKTNVIVLEVTLNLFQGDVERAKKTANEWTKRKRVQPRNTAGCTFKNIPSDKQWALGFPTPSVGYIVDKVFGWRGKSIGGAQISENHANFIENKGGATAKDVLELINEVKAEAKKRFDLDLETEINLLGFEK